MEIADGVLHHLIGMFLLFFTKICEIMINLTIPQSLAGNGSRQPPGEVENVKTIIVFIPDTPANR